MMMLQIVRGMQVCDTISIFAQSINSYSGSESNGIHDGVSPIGARRIKYTGRVRETIEDGVHATPIIALVNVGW